MAFLLPEEWSLKDMHGNAGEIAIVTGGASGVGFEVAKQLACHCRYVILADSCTKEQGKVASAAINALEEVKCGPGHARFMYINPSSLESVRNFAARFRSKEEPRIEGRLRLLVHCADVTLPEPRETDDGIDLTLQVNYFAPFLLTNLLLPSLVTASPSRVVFCGSEAEVMASVGWEDLRGTQGKSPGGMSAFARSKLMTHMMAVELNSRASDSEVLSFIAHPGYVQAEVRKQQRRTLRRDPTNGIGKAFDALAPLVTVAPERASLPLLFCAAAPEAEEYAGCFVGPAMGWLGRKTSPMWLVNRNANDSVACGKLWRETAEILEVDTRVKLAGRFK